MVTVQEIQSSTPVLRAALYVLYPMFCFIPLLYIPLPYSIAPAIGRGMEDRGMIE